MGLISCPNCGKQISSKAPLCSYCGYQLGEVTERDLEIFQARKIRDHIYRLSMISYGVITVFIFGFGWYWWDSGGFSRASSIGPFVLMGIAAVGYLAVRAFLFRARQQRKAMRAKRQMSNELRKNL